MTAAPARGRYQGMEQILRYNLPMYVGAAAAAVVAAAGARWLPVAPPVSAALLAFAAAVVLGSASSLLVSHYVYDRSELFRWDWLFVRVPAPASWTVVHAGLDEVSPALRERFPGARGDVLDIYDPRQMTEPAIARARRSTPPPEPARAASAGALPAADGSSDLVMLFFAAHELRQRAARDRFFAELRRIVRPHGRIVVVERSPCTTRCGSRRSCARSSSRWRGEPGPPPAARGRRAHLPGPAARRLPPPLQLEGRDRALVAPEPPDVLRPLLLHRADAGPLRRAVVRDRRLGGRAQRGLAHGAGRLRRLLAAPAGDAALRLRREPVAREPLQHRGPRALRRLLDVPRLGVRHRALDADGGARGVDERAARQGINAAG
ncbi:MAG: hypothetical protein DMF78_09860 [Acidobacteria bacterium]|nr:MAG: hypothetical protein DMF78_09860 [Acidobacteriota bacterium]